MKNKTQGLTVRSAREHKATTKGVLEGSSKVSGMEVARPEPAAHHRFEVQIYDMRVGRFVYFKFVSSKAEAQREMERQRALGHRVKHMPVVHVGRGPVGGRQHSRHAQSSLLRKRMHRDLTTPPRKLDPQLITLQLQINRLRKQLGIGVTEALPASIVRCEQIIKRLKARLA